MRLPMHAWSSTLSKLGKKAVRKPRDKYQRKVSFERPEARMLLTVDPDYSGGYLTINSDGDGDAITVTTENSSGNHYVRINGSNFDIGNIPAAEVTSITVNGQGGEDTINLSAVSELKFSSLTSVTLNGGNDDDEIQGSQLADTISGGDGEDTLIGLGGIDTFSGAPPEDVIDQSEGLGPQFDYVGNAYTAVASDSPGPLELTTYVYESGDAQQVTFSAKGYSPLASTLLYDLNGDPGQVSTMEINGTTGDYSWMPMGVTENTTYEFTVVATDEYGAYIEQEVVIYVVFVEDLVPFLNVNSDTGVFGETNTSFNGVLHTFSVDFVNENDSPYENFTWSIEEYSGNQNDSSITPRTSGYYGRVADFVWHPSTPINHGAYPFTIRVTDGATFDLRREVWVAYGYQSWVYTAPTAASGDRTLPVSFNPEEENEEDEDTYVPANLHQFPVQGDWGWGNDFVVGNEWEFVVESGPQYGTLSDDPHQLLYTPFEGYMGGDSITYHIRAVGYQFEDEVEFIGNTATIDLKVGQPFYEILEFEILYDINNAPDGGICPTGCNLPTNSVSETAGHVQGGQSSAGANFSPTPDTPIAHAFLEADEGYDGGGFFAEIWLDGDVAPSTTLEFTDPGIRGGDKIDVYFPVNLANRPSGQYKYSVKFRCGNDANIVVEQPQLEPVTVITNDDFGLGKGWRVAGVDRLLFALDENGDVAEGVVELTWLRDDGRNLKFSMGDATSSEGAIAEGDQSGSRLFLIDNAPPHGVSEATPRFVMRDRFGTISLYDDYGLLTHRIDRNDNITEYEYEDKNGDTFDFEIVSIISKADNRGDTFQYSSGKITSITDFADRVTNIEYDGSNRLQFIYLPPPDPLDSEHRPTTEVEYYDDDRIKLVKGNGIWTQYAWDNDGNSVKVTLSDDDGGTDTQNENNPVEYLQRSYVPNRDLVVPIQTLSGTIYPVHLRESERLSVARICLDVANSPRPGHYIDARGYKSTFEVDLHDRIKEWTDPTDYTTFYSWNGMNLLAGVNQPDPDGAGNLSALVTTYDYDEFGNLKQINYPDGTDEQWTYNTDFGQVETYFDGEGRETRYDIDPANGDIRSVTYIVGEPDDESEGPDDDISYYFTYSDGTGGFPEGFLTQIEDPLGRFTTYEYFDESEEYNYLWLKKIIFADESADEAAVNFEYDDFGNVSAYLDEIGRRTEYVYDALDQLIQLTLEDPDGPSNPLESPIYQYTYCLCGALVKIADANENADPTTPENVTQYGYDMRRRLQTVTEEDPDGPGGSSGKPETKYLYDKVGNLIQVLDANNKATSYQYDSLNRVISMTLPDSDGPGGELTAPVYQYEYDHVGNMISMTDPLERVTEYVYDELGRILEVIEPDPDGESPFVHPTTVFAYDDSGLLESVLDPLERLTEYEYDDLGRLTKVILPDPDGPSGDPRPEIEYVYDDASNLKKVIDALDRETTYDYDNRDRLITVTQPDADGNPLTTNDIPVWHYAYNDASELETVTDPLSHITTYEYDGVGRLKKMILPDPNGNPSTGPESPEYEWQYDPNGNVIKAIDARDQETDYTYDRLDRLIHVAQPDADGDSGTTDDIPEWTYTYDDLSRLETVKDPLERVTTYEYDNLSRATKVTLPDPDGNPMSGDSAPYYQWQYDAVGNVKKQIDAELNETTYDYDDLDRLKQVTQPDADGNPLTTDDIPEWLYSYDAAGQLQTATDPMSRVTDYDYDGLGRLKEVLSPDPDGGSSQLAPRMRYTYDAVGNLKTATDRLGNETSYDYDRLNRQKSFTNPNEETTLYGYDRAGNLLTLTDPEDNVTTWAYDDLDRVKSESIVVSSVTYSRLYEYDANGNLTKKTDRNGRITEFEYDFLNRQTAENWLGEFEDLLHTIDYGYSVASELTHAGDINSQYDFEYDDLGRAKTITTTIAGLTDPVTFTQDFNANGQRTSLKADIGATPDFENVYTYDNLSRLTRLDQKSQTSGNAVAEKRVDFAYNLDGQFDTIERYADLAGSELVATSTYGYDLTGRLTSLVHEAPDTSNIATYGFAWNEGNRLSSFTNAQHTDENADYDYDDAGQLKGADRSGISHDEDYEYDDNGNRVEVAQPTSLAPEAVWNFNEGSGTSVADSTGNGHTATISGSATWDSDTPSTGEGDYSLLLNTSNGTSGYASLGSNLLASEFTVSLYFKAEDVNGSGRPPANGRDQMLFAQGGTKIYLHSSGLRATFANTSSQSVNLSFTGITLADNTWYHVVLRYNGSNVTLQVNGQSGGSGSSVPFSPSNKMPASGSTYLGRDSGSTNRFCGKLADVRFYELALTDDQIDAIVAGHPDQLLSEYTTGDHNRLASDGRYNYLYDGEGNLATRVSLTDDSYTVYEWDFRNRLTSVASYNAADELTGRSLYTYDAFNRRIAKYLDLDGGEEVTIDRSEFYVYDGTDIVLDFVDSDGEDIAESALAHRYLWGPAVDQLLAQEDYDAGEDETEEVLWALGDHQGSLRDYVTYDAGSNETTVAVHFNLDSFGNILAGDTSQTRYVYTGQEFDPETGLYYYDRRYYDPTVGRFISEDPIGFNGDPSNVYRYVGNAATMHVDPTGQIFQFIFQMGSVLGGSPSAQAELEGIQQIAQAAQAQAADAGDAIGEQTALVQNDVKDGNYGRAIGRQTAFFGGFCSQSIVGSMMPGGPGQNGMARIGGTLANGLDPEATSRGERFAPLADTVALSAIDIYFIVAPAVGAGAGKPPSGGSGTPTPRPSGGTSVTPTTPTPAEPPVAPTPGNSSNAPNNGPGQWIPKNESLGTGKGYQLQQVPGKEGQTYRVPYKNPKPNGKAHVDFDDFDPIKNKPVDCKQSVATTKKTLDQARRQIDAANQNGLGGVVWKVPNRAQKLRAEAFLRRKGVTGIEVIVSE